MKLFSIRNVVLGLFVLSLSACHEPEAHHEQHDQHDDPDVFGACHRKLVDQDLERKDPDGHRDDQPDCLDAGERVHRVGDRS